MPDTARDLIKQTISNTPGTAGSLTLSTASTGYLALGASDDGKTFTVLISASDSDTAAKEMRSGCTYTYSTTTLTRGTLVAGTAIDLTSSAVVSVVMQADSGRRWDAAALEHSTVTGTSGAISAAVNTLYVADMSGWTADRTLTLPATAAVGDRVGVMVSVGDDAYEWLITAASGDTLNGVAGGTEWSRVFITGEVVVMRCVVANSTWVVEYDGRIPQQGLMDLTTAADGETAATYTRPTQASSAGAWTSRIDVGGVVSTANDYMLVRRAGKFQVSLGYAPKDAGVSGNYVNARIILNDSQEEAGPSATCVGGAGVNRCAASKLISMAAGDYIRYHYRTEAGSLGTAAFRGSFLSLMELLP